MCAMNTAPTVYEQEQDASVPTTAGFRTTAPTEREVSLFVSKRFTRGRA